MENRHRIWFRRTGRLNWTPCTTEGWIATAAFTIVGIGGTLVLSASKRFEHTAPLWALLTFGAFAVVFVTSAQWKNDGKGR